jgi:hypothetical protein
MLHSNVKLSFEAFSYLKYVSLVLKLTRMSSFSSVRMRIKNHTLLKTIPDINRKVNIISSPLDT